MKRSLQDQVFFAGTILLAVTPISRAACPHCLNQPIVELAIPFAREKRLDFLAAAHELGAIAPDAVDRISEGDAGRIARVPGILGEPRLLRGGLGIERGQRRAGHERAPAY